MRFRIQKLLTAAADGRSWSHADKHVCSHWRPDISIPAGQGSPPRRIRGPSISDWNLSSLLGDVPTDADLDLSKYKRKLANFQNLNNVLGKRLSRNHESIYWYRIRKMKQNHWFSDFQIITCSTAATSSGKSGTNDEYKIKLKEAAKLQLVCIRSPSRSTCLSCAARQLHRWCLHFIFPVTDAHSSHTLSAHTDRNIQKLQNPGLMKSRWNRSETVLNHMF